MIVSAVLIAITFVTPNNDPSTATATRVAAILESRCIRCHGGSSTKGGLSLTTIEAMAKGGDSGPAFETKKPDESLIVDRIRGDSPEMPKGEGPLSAEEVREIEAWIAAGSPWPEGLVLKEPPPQFEPWWAFQPLDRPTPPRPQGAEWARTPIDLFILQALQEKGLQPTPEADRRTLIRRLSFDLLGLPPTLDDLRRFEEDQRPGAYERLVERYLDSPHYGERWGRHWLDVAHYGDTHGYDKDKRRDHAWPYRDYVIRAFNEDRPYSRFILEQLAGDVLFPDDPSSAVATGFVAAGPWDFVGHAELREGTVDKEKTRLLDRDDMLATTISTFSSLTAHCARCHDHKFDPIPQRDYYRLQAVFAGVDRGDRPYESTENEERRRTLQSGRTTLLARRQVVVDAIKARTSPDLQALDDRIAALAADREARNRPSASSGSPSNGYHSLIFPKEAQTAWVQVDLGEPRPIDVVRVFPARPVDFADTPGFGFPRRWRIETSDEPTFVKPRILFVEARPEGETAPDEPRVFQMPGHQARFVRISADRLWKRTEDYVFALSELQVISQGRNVALDVPVAAQDSIEGGLWAARYLVDGFTSREKLPAEGDLDAARRYAIAGELEHLRQDRRVLADRLVEPSLRAELVQIDAEIAAMDLQRKMLQSEELVYALQSHAPRPIHVLKRGEVEHPGDPVDAGTLSCLSSLESSFVAAGDDEGARRAALARWIADRRNVLTWRSIVNRVWHFHFGRGIVDTPNDFGRNGGLPSHPELLDYLAAEFRDGGQSIKSLHRMIVLSASYRQTSRNRDDGQRIDADNRLLWRQNARRLDAESIRDSVMVTAGTMDWRMGGPGYEPFQFKDDHSPTYDHEAVARILAPETFRRTVYRFAVRSVPDPFVECLDGADPNVNTPVRNSTITALQALALLNDPFMLFQSERFADRLRNVAGGLPSQIDRAFELAVARPATDHERESLTAHARRHGLASACRVILNLNEFVFVD
jgi:hypothetical protein